MAAQIVCPQCGPRRRPHRGCRGRGLLSPSR
ncbi:MAG: 50S ribosomal protein L32 [Acidobacteria bacterium]|nr:50S ribosomal protein L32 [Acidobacteriota bacterium]